jgi:hypothetical protein
VLHDQGTVETEFMKLGSIALVARAGQLVPSVSHPYEMSYVFDEIIKDAEHHGKRAELGRGAGRSGWSAPVPRDVGR